MQEIGRTNLVLVKENGEHRTFPISKNVTVLGRSSKCDFQISIPEISRKHCQLKKLGNRMAVIDMNSRNGILLNGMIVEDEADLDPGDEIRLGPLRLIIQIDGKPEKVPTLKQNDSESQDDFDDSNISEKALNQKTDLNEMKSHWLEDEQDQ